VARKLIGRSLISVEELDDFKLRLGTRTGAGDQKAVDGLIIADLISLPVAEFGIYNRPDLPSRMVHLVHR
jgi:hypothetical protein